MKMPILETNRESAPASALRLLKGVGAPVSRIEEISPVETYLDALNSQSGRRSMRVCLRRAAAQIGARDEHEVEWQHLRYAHVQRIKESLQRAGYQPATINATLCALRGVARAAWLSGLEGMSGENYQRIAAVKNVPYSRTLGPALTLDELEGLLSVCRRDACLSGRRDLCTVALLAGGGLRRHEAVALTLADWDPERRRLHVHGKGDRDRHITFSDGATLKAISNWLRARGDEEGAFLCPVRKGRGGYFELRHMTDQAVYNMVARRLRQAGITRFTPHALRRTFATGLLDSGADPLIVQRVLGHASVETTMRYDCRDEDAQRRAMEMFHLPAAWRALRVRKKRSPRRGHRRRRRHKA